MVTSIQISKELLEKLKSMKIYDSDTYEEIIWDLVEDRMAPSKEMLKRIKKSEKDIAEGKVLSLETVKKKLKI